MNIIKYCQVSSQVFLKWLETADKFTNHVFCRDNCAEQSRVRFEFVKTLKMKFMLQCVRSASRRTVIALECECYVSHPKWDTSGVVKAHIQWRHTL